MKRYLLLLNFVLVTGFAQNAKEANAVAEYKIFNNTDSPNILHSTLYVNGSSTIYIADYDTQVSTMQNMKQKGIDCSDLKNISKLTINKKKFSILTTLVKTLC